MLLLSTLFLLNFIETMMLAAAAVAAALVVHQLVLLKHFGIVYLFANYILTVLLHVTVAEITNAISATPSLNVFTQIPIYEFFLNKHQNLLHAHFINVDTFSR